MARQLVIAAFVSGILSTALAQSYKSKPSQDSVGIDVAVSGSPGSGSVSSGSVNPALTSSNANYWQADPYNGQYTPAQFQPYVPTVPVISFQKQLHKLPPWLNSATAAVVPSAVYNYQPLTPLGALAAFKGDLLPTVIVTGIIAAGILLLFMLKGALMSGVAGVDYDMRKKRSSEDVMLQEYEYLARLIVPALQSEQCLQNMFCQLAKSSSALEQSGISLSALLSAMPKSLGPSLQVFKNILENTGPCELYVCPIMNHAKP